MEVNLMTLLALCVLATFCTRPISARLQNATLPITAPGEVYTVCVGPDDPFANCTVGLLPSDAAGYSVEVFKRVAIFIGLQLEQYTFVCMTFSDLVADMTDPSGVCDLTAAGMAFTALRLASGIKFVYPEDYRTGLTVMVHASVKRGGQWLFLKPFRWEVWLLLLCAAVAVGLSVHLVEVISKRHLPKGLRTKFRMRGEGGFSESLWAAIAQVASAGDPLAGASLPSRLIIFVWCFVILLLLTIYTGNAAAILTTTSINTSIQSVSDLRGRNWGTYVGWVPVLANQGLVASRIFPLSIPEDLQTAVDALLNDEVEAIVFECALVSSITSYICDIQQIGDCFSPTDQGITFWQNASDVSVARAGAAIIALEDGGDLERLRETFISPASTCSNQLSSGSTSVTFMQVSGLWIVLAVAIAVAVLWSFILHHVNKRKYVATLRRSISSRRRGTLSTFDAESVAGPAKSAGVEPQIMEVDADIEKSVKM